MQRTPLQLTITTSGFYFTHHHKIEKLTTILLVGVISAIIFSITSPILRYTCFTATNKLIFTTSKICNRNRRTAVSKVHTQSYKTTGQIYDTLLNAVESLQSCKEHQSSMIYSTLHKKIIHDACVVSSKEDNVRLEGKLLKIEILRSHNFVAEPCFVFLNSPFPLSHMIPMKIMN